MLDAPLAAALRDPTSADAAPPECFLGLPAAERALAAQLAPRLEHATSCVKSGAAETPPLPHSLLDSSGKDMAKLRSFEPQVGVGMALCRLDALGAGVLSGAAAEAASGSEALGVVPFRPSWWPEHIQGGAGSEGGARGGGS